MGGEQRSMIADATFEALSIFDDGYTHWVDGSDRKPSKMATEGYLAGSQETGWRLTTAGEAALTEYRARHGLISPSARALAAQSRRTGGSGE